MTTPASPAPAVAEMPGAEMLFDFWYPALRSDRIRGNRLRAAMLLGVPLAIGRDRQGQVFALRDACPHRAMPLSLGWFDGNLVECCYHGWKFEPVTGQCREIPSLTADSKLKVERIFASALPAAEHDGYVWVFVREPEERRKSPSDPVRAEAGEAEACPRLPIFSEKYKSAHLSAELPANVDHGIIGLMDPAHGPFVHQAWWWRTRHSIHEKQKRFEPIPGGFRMSAHTPSSNSAPYKLLRAYAAAESITTQIDFVLPNVRYEQIRAGKYWFSSMTTVTPTTADRCRIDFLAAWNIFRAVPLVKSIFRFFGRRFIRQDQRTMEKQAIGLRHSSAMMLIDDADRPAKWYFRLKEAYLESKRTGQPMRHPMAGPVTLRWRS